MKIKSFWATIIFLILIIFPASIGQFLPIEFTQNEIKQYYYFAMVTFLAFSFLSFLYFRMKNQPNGINVFKLGLQSILIGIIYIFMVIFIMIFVGFGEWKNENIMYREKGNPNILISQQIYDVGAFGYSKRRIVKIIPVLEYFQIATATDTTVIDKTNWEKITGESDFKY